MLSNPVLPTNLHQCHGEPHQRSFLGWFEHTTTTERQCHHCLTTLAFHGKGKPAVSLGSVTLALIRITSCVQLQFLRITFCQAVAFVMVTALDCCLASHLFQDCGWGQGCWPISGGNWHGQDWVLWLSFCYNSFAMELIFFDPCPIENLHSEIEIASSQEHHQGQGQCLWNISQLHWWLWG